jgi:hypothetical protein
MNAKVVPDRNTTTAPAPRVVSLAARRPGRGLVSTTQGEIAELDQAITTGFAERGYVRGKLPGGC